MLAGGELPAKYSLLEGESSEGRGDGTYIRVQVLFRFFGSQLTLVIFSSLETPKITVEGEEKKDCEEGSTAHPLDTIQVFIAKLYFQIDCFFILLEFILKSYLFVRRIRHWFTCSLMLHFWTGFVSVETKQYQNETKKQPKYLGWWQVGLHQVRDRLWATWGIWPSKWHHIHSIESVR